MPKENFACDVCNKGRIKVEKEGGLVDITENIISIMGGKRGARRRLLERAGEEIADKFWEKNFVSKREE